MSDLHQLLPWFMNGTLDAGERSSFESHLADCAACRDEMSIIEDLRREVRNPEWDVLAEHPSPQALAEALLDGADDPGTRRHLAVCLTCAEEARWLGGARASRPPARRWAGRAALAAAAVIAVVMLAGVVMRPRPGGHLTGLLLVDPVPSSERTRDGQHVVQVQAGADVVHLLFEVDLGAEAFPASFHLLDAAGRPVFTMEKLESTDLLRGVFLFLDCSRLDCPDGAYVARVSPGGGRLAGIEYPFRLTTLP